MSAGPTARRRVGRPPRIDAAMVIAAACEIGLDRVTMRAVAERLGFANPFHFSRVYRRAMGVPPSRERGGASLHG